MSKCLSRQKPIIFISFQVWVHQNSNDASNPSIDEVMHTVWSINTTVKATEVVDDNDNNTTATIKQCK